jgi:DNA polymerase
MPGWEELIKECTGCRKCGLGNTRTNIVIGRGNVNAPIMLIGEGPGEQEDLQGSHL